jgi:hypothetical protein
MEIPKPENPLSFQSTINNTNMSRNQANWGRRRTRLPSYSDTSITELNAAEDTIQQLQAALNEEQRTVATLRRERDEAQNSA